MTRRTLHNLGAAPRRSLIGEEAWIASNSSEDDRRQRRSEIMRQNLSHPSQHWLVEEAERRRLAEQSGTDRPPAQLSPRQGPAQHGDRSVYSSTAQIPYSSSYYDKIDKPHQSTKSPTYDKSPKPVIANHTPVNEVVQKPAYDHSRSLRPLPDVIKQTVVERLKSPQRHSYAHPPPSPLQAYELNSSPHYSYSQRGSYSSPGHYHAPQLNNYESNYAVPQKSPSHYATPPSRPLSQSKPQSRSHMIINQPPSRHLLYTSPSYSSLPSSDSNTPLSKSYNNGYSEPIYQNVSHLKSRSPNDPPVPPKNLLYSSPSSPPRDDSHAEQVVSVVNGNQRCAHCQNVLGEHGLTSI